MKWGGGVPLKMGNNFREGRGGRRGYPRAFVPHPLFKIIQRGSFSRLRNNPDSKLHLKRQLQQNGLKEDSLAEVEQVIAVIKFRSFLTPDVAAVEKRCRQDIGLS